MNNLQERLWRIIHDVKKVTIVDSFVFVVHPLMLEKVKEEIEPRDFTIDIKTRKKQLFGYPIYADERLEDDQIRFIDKQDFFSENPDVFISSVTAKSNIINIVFTDGTDINIEISEGLTPKEAGARLIHLAQYVAIKEKFINK